MIRLSPTTDSQTISIIPRAYTVASDLSMVIVEDGTRKTQTINNITNSFFNIIGILIFDFIKAGPITALNSVPGKDPKEKHAKNIPAKLLSKI